MITDDSVAIIGAACLVPGAINRKQFWANCKSPNSQLSEVLSEEQALALLGLNEPQFAGQIPDVKVDSNNFGIPKNEFEQLDNSQALALYAANECLSDAGYGRGMGNLSNTSIYIDINASIYANTQVPPNQETPHNLIVPLLSSVFGLHAHGFAIDVGQSGGLASVYQGMEALRAGQCDMALVGGIGIGQSVSHLANLKTINKQSKLQDANDTDATNITCGDAVAILLLKPYADALRDNNRMLAVIHGAGAVSYSPGSAPELHVDGLLLAMRQAYKHINYKNVDLIQSVNIDSLPSGRIEREAIKTQYSDLTKPPYIVNNYFQLGYLGAATANVGLISIVEALQSKIIPPMCLSEEATDNIKKAGAHVTKEALPWENNDERYAAINSFTNGGRYYHFVLGTGPEVAKDWTHPADSVQTQQATADDNSHEQNANTAQGDSFTLISSQLSSELSGFFEDEINLNDSNVEGDQALKQLLRTQSDRVEVQFESFLKTYSEAAVAISSLSRDVRRYQKMLSEEFVSEQFTNKVADIEKHQDIAVSLMESTLNVFDKQLDKLIGNKQGIGHHLDNNDVEVPQNLLNEEIDDPLSQSSDLEDVRKMSREEVLEKVIFLLAEKTGYPSEVIEPEMDLETDLGIDSISRLEIFGEIYARFLVDVDDFMAASEIFTIEEIADFVITSAIEGDIDNKPAISQRSLMSRFNPAMKTLEIERYNCELRFLPHPDQVTDLLIQGVCIVVNDGAGLSDCLSEQLRARGVQVHQLNYDSFYDEELQDTDENLIKDYMRNLADEYGMIGALLYLHPDTLTENSIELRYSERDYQRMETHYLVSKQIHPYLIESAKLGRAYHLGVSRMDGQLGCATKENHTTGYGLVQAALHGLAKTLQQEWSSVACKSVDIEASVSVEQTSNLILAELYGTDWLTGNVAYRDNQRFTLEAILAEAKSDAIIKVPTKDDLFLVLGGSRGITAICLIKMAACFGCQFIIVGRSPLDVHKRHSEESGEGHQDEEQGGFSAIQKTLDEIDAAGGRAEYCQADITDSTAFKSIIATQLQGRKISGIIHGAGNINDKALVQKTMDDYRPVFDSKVRGLQNLLSVVDLEYLQYALFFTSISGFFGNMGQSDYAMANEVLNKSIGELSSIAPNLQVARSINWGPWEGGMMDPQLQAVYANITGIISYEYGAQAFINEFTADNHCKQVLYNGFATHPLLKTLYSLRSVEVHRNQLRQWYANSTTVDSPILVRWEDYLNWIKTLTEEFAPGYSFNNISDIKMTSHAYHSFMDTDTLVMYVEPQMCQPGMERLSIQVTIFRSVRQGIPLFSGLLCLSLKPLVTQLEFNMIADENLHLRGDELYQKYLFSIVNSNQYIDHFPVFDMVRFRAVCVLSSENMATNRQGKLDVLTIECVMQASQLWIRHFLLKPANLLSSKGVALQKTVRFDHSFSVYGFVKNISKKSVSLDLHLIDDIDGTVCFQGFDMVFQVTNDA